MKAIRPGYIYRMCRSLRASLGSVRILLFFLVAPASLVAQAEESYAFVIYAEGYDLSVYRNGELMTYDVLVDDVIGMPLLPGDLVQTDAQTFVEIQVMPSRTVVKVAENTTFEIERIGGAGGGTFNMAYGRVRARVERITGDDPFQIRGFTAVAGVRGTDFGYDLVVERQATSELQTKVYVFEGEVDVTETLREVAPEETVPREPVTSQRVRIGANEMVSVVTDVPPELAERADAAVEGGSSTPIAPSTITPPVQNVVFRTSEIEEEIEAFWDEQAFREEPVDPSMVEESFPGIGARVQQLTEERRRYEELQRLRREGLLATPDDLLTELESEVEDEEREPETVLLGDPLPDDRVRRILVPRDDDSPSRRSIIAGHWLVGAGLLFEATGALITWYDDGFTDYESFSAGGPGQGMMVGGGVFITSGVINYLIGIIRDRSETR